MERAIVGWREWLVLPDLGVKAIKVKVDTGARTSALHVTDLEIHRRKKIEYAHFNIHPMQHKSKPVVRARAKVVEWRDIMSSSGHLTRRPVILTTFNLGQFIWESEITLVNRDLMGFRMLLGREAVRKRFLVNPGRSFYLTREINKIIHHKD